MTLKWIKIETCIIITNVKYGCIFDKTAKRSLKLVRIINHKLKDKRLSNDSINDLLFELRIAEHFSKIENCIERNMNY